jgi:hypothetical protein
MREARTNGNEALSEELRQKMEAKYPDMFIGGR